MSTTSKPSTARAVGTTGQAVMTRFIRDYQLGGDEQVLYETVSPDFVDHTPMFPGAPRGPEGVKAVFDALRSAFDGFSVDVLHQVADDEHVMTHKIFRGRHTGEFLGIPATGTSVRFTVMDVVRIADGRITEHWGLVDRSALLGQLQAAMDAPPDASALQPRTGGTATA
ncbi:ester cyclase [Blastococcus deserti]|uniref:Ester cyclase n=1 Tax=Blastococcus deserti TaxID=2259033 RepID=A0ABW4XA64_9ACTN